MSTNCCTWPHVYNSVIYLETEDGDLKPSLYSELEWVALLRRRPELCGQGYVAKLSTGEVINARMFEAIHGLGNINK